MAVYMIRAGENGPVKIGKADDPESRLSYLQTAHWEMLRIMRLFEGSFHEESQLRAMFADLHIRLEWHHFSQAMMRDVGLVEVSLDGVRLVRPRAVRARPITIPDNASFLDEINQFLCATGMSVSALGKGAVNDAKFITRLRSGKNVQTATLNRVSAFIRSHSTGVIQ